MALSPSSQFAIADGYTGPAQSEALGDTDNGLILTLAWRSLMAGIVINALYCHISPGLMVRLQSNPWTTQFNWLFGVKAQNFQTLNFVLYHQSMAGKVSHIPTLITDFICWTYFIYYIFGPVVCFLVLSLVVAQSFSVRFFPLVIFTAISCVLAMTASACVASLPDATALQMCRYAQVAIMIGGLARTLGHVFEKKQPPMPATKRDVKWIRFKSLGTISTARRMVIFPAAVLAETSAGMPLRLFVPLLNAIIGYFFQDIDDTRPEGLQSVGELERVSKDILEKGWKLAAPDIADMITSATKLETLPKTSPDVFLPRFWHYVFMTEGFILFVFAFLWLVSPATFLTSLGWSTSAAHTASLLSSLTGPRSPTMFALCTAASLMVCGFVWILLRMLCARNMDIRAFCYLIEGLTLYLFLQVALALDLQLNGLASDSGEQEDWRRPNKIGIYASSALLLILAAVHCFFLSSEVPRIRRQSSGVADDFSCSGWSSESSFEKPVRRKSRSSSCSSTPTNTDENKRRTAEASGAESSEPDDVFMPLNCEQATEHHMQLLRQRRASYVSDVILESDTDGCACEKPLPQNPSTLHAHSPAGGVRRPLTKFRPRMCSWPLNRAKAPRVT